LDGPRRRARVRRVIAAVALAGVVVVLVVGIARSQRHATTVQVTHEPSTSTTGPRSTTVSRGDATIAVEYGWYVSEKSLTPWLVSPHELFSIATVPLSPSRNSGNQSACPSEIAKVAVDGIGAGGAYVWIGEWPNNWPGNMPSPRPAHSSSISYSPGCPMSNGLQAWIALLRDGDHEYSITYVIGPRTPTARRAEIDRMLDSLRFTAAP
ncbi:MAG TPA: hypothetical protein VN636_06020, partial [Acidimicrobiia bacterium]|nr:hypothetical protein [Acidimicrobiia bacterium]